MNSASTWVLFIAIAVGTFALRVSFVELHGRWRMPPLLRRALAYVPASVLAAITVPAVVFPHDPGELVLLGPYLPAAIVAGLVAWRSRNTVLTLVVGMATLWGLQALLA